MSIVNSISNESDFFEVNELERAEDTLRRNTPKVSDYKPGVKQTPVKNKID